MAIRRPERREAVVFSTGLHWIALAPAVLWLGVAGAVQRWGTSGVLEWMGADALAEQTLALTGFDLDSSIATLATVLGLAALASGLVRALSTQLRITASGVRWEQRGFRAHDISARFEAIEGVRVEQGLLGRILGFGTITVLGRNAIGRRRRMARPGAFRKAFDNQMSTWLCRDLAADPRRKKAASG